MSDVKNMNTEQVFMELKKSLNKISVDDLTEYEKNLLVALNSALKTEQKVLLEQCVFFNKCLKKENELIELGFDKFIYKDDLQDIIEQLQMSDESKNIYFIELDRFPRVIPSDVVEKITVVKRQNIFDKYYVLYTDYTKKAKQQVTKTRDPIVFGAFSTSDKDSKVHYMGERIYYIADWIDEYCDLTLDRLLREVPEKIHSLYANNDIDLNLIEKLKDSELGNFLYDDIKKQMDKKEQKKDGLIRTTFEFLKRVFS
ncbi:hypothetical protein ACHJH3_06795 [Campylobacter sp. MOP7]|uniref:hypothetical protein n=1 Tax=Campylobacter canis TaxID=3378588 RepID=UPI00387ED426